MTFTVDELKNAIEEWEAANGVSDLFQAVFDESIEVLPYLKGFGQVEMESERGGEGDGATIWVTLKVGNRYFERSGYYSSWGDSELDSVIYEVKPKQVMRIEYEAL